VPCLCLAGGSISTSEIDHLLKQQPLVRESLLKTFVLSESAYAETRLGSHFKHIGGARLGPYTIGATPIDPKAAPQSEITVCTAYRFFNSAGEEINPQSDEVFEATEVREKLIALMSLSVGAKHPQCPGSPNNSFKADSLRERP
jgi:hypothetical protein